MRHVKKENVLLTCSRLLSAVFFGLSFLFSFCYTIKHRYEQIDFYQALLYKEGWDYDSDVKKPQKYFPAHLNC
jgi:hypothetical protein